VSLHYALRGIRRHWGAFTLLAAAAAVTVALATLLLATVTSATTAFVGRVPAVPLPAPAVAFYSSGGAGYPAQKLPTGLGMQLVVAGFPGSPADGQVAAPSWLVQAAGLQLGDPVAVGGHTLSLGAAYTAPWDHALPLLLVGRNALPLAGKLYPGSDPPSGSDWVLRPDSGAVLARQDMGAVYSPVDLLVVAVAVFGALGVAVAFLLGLLRRRRQLGIARAIGWESGQLASWLLLEAGLVAVAGAALGLIMAQVASASFGLPAPTGLDRLVAVLVTAAVLALAASRPRVWLQSRTVAELLQ